MAKKAVGKKAKSAVRNARSKADGTKAKRSGQKVEWPPGRRAKYSQWGLETQGIPTGITDLDYLTGGLCRGELILLASRHGSLRTTLASRLAGFPGGAASLYVSRFDDRIDLWSRVVRSPSKYSFDGDDVPFLVDDSGERSVDAIAARARRLQGPESCGGYTLLVVDYLQHIGRDCPDGDNRKRNEETARALKALAVELRMPVICLVGLSRDGSDSKDADPTQADLRREGQIDRHADIVIIMQRRFSTPLGAEEEILDLVVAKNSGGPAGTVPIAWCRRDGRFANIVDNDSGLTAAQKKYRLEAMGIEDQTKPSPNFDGMTMIGTPLSPEKAEESPYCSVVKL